MTFGTLAIVGGAGLLGPLLAWRESWRLPIVLGELAAGAALGVTGFRVLHAGEQDFTFLADVGFALVMFVAGSHVPVRDKRVAAALGAGLARALTVAAVAVGLGFLVATAFGTHHGAVYGVLFASSSAALILPMIDSLGISGGNVLGLLAQVAIADASCIVALPLVIDPAHAGRAALGALAVIGCAVALFVVLRFFEHRGWRRGVHRVSEKRRFALELRINLVVLFLLAALAVRTHVSIMLAGFSFGLAMAGVGEPRRLAKQLFAVTDGFFAPLFFVWLGASVNLRQLGEHPSAIGLGVALGAGAVISHLAGRIAGQSVLLSGLAAAQIGVPVAATTIGTQLHVLRPGEAGAILLGAVLTIAAATVSGALAATRSTAQAATPMDKLPPTTPSN